MCYDLWLKKNGAFAHLKQLRLRAQNRCAAMDQMRRRRGVQETADERLDRLIAQERRTRASSMPAGRRAEGDGTRGGVSQPGQDQRAGEMRPLESGAQPVAIENGGQGRSLAADFHGLAISDGAHQGRYAVQPDRPPGLPQQMMVDDLQPGHQERSAERQGQLVLPQRVPVPYGGFPQGFDPAQGQWHADSAATEMAAMAIETGPLEMLQAGVGTLLEGLIPRRLEYPQGMIGGFGNERSQGVTSVEPPANPFWSPGARMQLDRNVAVEDQRGPGSTLPQHPSTSPVVFVPPTPQTYDQGGRVQPVVQIARLEFDQPRPASEGGRTRQEQQERVGPVQGALPLRQQEPHGGLREGYDPAGVQPRELPAGLRDVRDQGLHHADRRGPDGGTGNGQVEAAAAGLTATDVDRVRRRILQEAEEQFQREVRRLHGSGQVSGSGSYQTAMSVGGSAGVVGVPSGHPQPRDMPSPVPAVGLSGPPPMMPSPGPGAGTGGLQPTINLEPLRSHELPALPPVGAESALMFGDWMAVIFPVMADISPSARQWWVAVVREVESLYATWLQSTPLERLRMKPEWFPGDENGIRIEQRATSMLLSSIPEPLRKDIISSRKLSVVSILFKLHTIYQPGGGAERNALLRSLTDLKIGSSLQELLLSTRSWRRWIARAGELRLVLPDPLVLMQTLVKMSDVLAKHGGAQVTYRLASVRQELQLDHRPRMEGVLEYAEFIQAECEELALATGSSVKTSQSQGTGVQQPGGGSQAVIKAMAMGTQGDGARNPPTSGKGSTPCKFWGSAGGCRRGEACGYLHSWENVEKRDRCYICSAEGHFSKECPTKKEKEKNPAKKVAKVKGTKEGAGTNDSQRDEKKDGKKVDSAAPVGQGKETEEKPNGSGGAPMVTQNDPAGELLQEATALLKSLRSLKAVKVKQIGTPTGNPKERMALLDGGATHGLRQARPEEVKSLEKIEVELASGTAWLYRHPDHRTLLSLDPVEVIIPLHRLVSLGFRIDWTSRGCRIHHRHQGVVNCILRGGCPVLPEHEGLKILDEMERRDAGTKGLPKDVLDWWHRRFPNMPSEIVKFMDGQEDGACDPLQTPWNRRQRRSHMRSKGVILNLFSGETVKPWKDIEGMGYTVINLDIVNGAQFDLNYKGVWAYLVDLCRKGRVCGVMGGPPCRTVSRLRHRSPGPRPLRNRGDGRWGLEHLEQWEKDLVWGDTALWFKQIALWMIADEHKLIDLSPFFVLENPQDPNDYMPEDTQLHQFPSYWCFPEVQACIGWMNGRLVTCDQGPMGHCKRKPTTLLTVNTPGLEELHGISGEGHGERASQNLQERISQSKSWAKWAPGLTAAVKKSLEMYLTQHSSMIKEEDYLISPSSSSSEEMPGVCKLDVEAWKTHVRNQHQPYRRDCRRCLELMGVDGKHRRSTGDSSAHCMSLDIVGPMPEGKDVGTDTRQKYFMVATVAMPKIPRESSQEGADDVPGEMPDEDVVSGENAVEQNSELLRALEDRPPVDDREVPPDRAVQALNEKWMEHIKELSAPVGVQNVTLAEPVESRNQHDVTRVASKLYCRFRAMGMEIRRLHTDRETGFLSRTFQSFCRNMGVYQTMTGGDENPSNGRIEAEVQCIKRRVRLLIKESGLEERYWPGIVRHAGEERMRLQLRRLGVPCKPLLPVGAMVTVKTKRWHRAGFGPLIAPFRTMRLMGPSPLMSTGYVLEADGHVQHARLAVQTDPTADRAVLELQAVDNPARPQHRLHGKQPRDPLLPQLPRPLQRSDAELLQELQREEEPLEPPPQLALEDQDPLHALDPDDMYWPESPVASPNDVDPALRQLRPGGEWPWNSCEKGEKPCEKGGNQGLEYDTCRGCGLLQKCEGQQCGMCDAKLPGLAEMKIPGVALCSLQHGRDLQRRQHEEHWAWKTLWNDELRKVAVGEEDGSMQGFILEYLEDQVSQRERELSDLDSDERVKLAAMKGPEGQSESTSGVHAVLQTYTVPLSQVKKDLEAWKPALEKELNSLVNVTGAIRQVKVQDLPKEPGYSSMQTVPSKLVPTVKAPDGRLKARIVLCGNLLEGGTSSESGAADKGKFDLYASGIDGVSLRCALKKGVEESWDIAMLDITTAFLLAPRCSRTLLVSTPPSILVQSGLIGPDDRWIIERAVYGLETSPADWQQHRDQVLRAVRWWSNGRHFWFQQTPESNLWNIFSAPGCEDSFTPVMDLGVRCGILLSYVDDFIILAETEVVKETLAKLTGIWRTSKPEWVGSDQWSKFCGLQLRWRGSTLQLAQPDYAREVLKRYPEVRPRLYPLPKLNEDTIEEIINPADVKKCQAVVGELLWLSTKTRPDLSYAVSYMGSRVSKSPRRVLELADHVLGYLKTTVDFALEYKTSGGAQGELDHTGRCVGGNRVEVYSDASFAPNGERSHQGLMAYWKGSLIQWESRTQPFCTLSTTESELLGYTDAMVLGESVGSVINVIEMNALDEAGGYILRGDNQSGLQLLQAPSGPWRTRHLRLRSNVLRERLQQKLWQVEHVPGAGLMVDLLTKAITVVKTWEGFYEAVGLRNTNEVLEPKEPQEPLDSETVKEKLATCAAALCALSSWKPTCPNSMIGRCISVSAIAAMTASLFKGMKSNSHPNQDLKRARSKETFGPPAATTEDEAPRERGVERRKMSGSHEPASFRIQALRLSGPREVTGFGADAMAVHPENHKPYGPPFDIEPICLAEFNVPPVPGRDRWRALSGGWWVKEHHEWRVRSFQPTHKNVPVRPADLEPDRFTIVFWKGPTGQWLQQNHHDSWLDEPKNYLPGASGSRSNQWVGFTFFKVKDTGIGSSGDRRVPGDQAQGTRDVPPTAAATHVGKGSAKGPIARARAAGPLVLRGSIARSFPGGLLQPVHHGPQVGDQLPQPRIDSSETGSSLSGSHQGEGNDHGHRLRHGRLGRFDEVHHEQAESESATSDAVFGAAHVERVDTYGYMLAHLRDDIEDQVYQETGEPLPPYGEEYPHAIDAPPFNGTRPRIAAIRDSLHGAYYQSGLHLERDPRAFQFEDEMSEPGEAIERLLHPISEPAGPHSRIPQAARGHDEDAHGSDDGFELLDA